MQNYATKFLPHYMEVTGPLSRMKDGTGHCSHSVPDVEFFSRLPPASRYLLTINLWPRVAMF